MSSGGQTPGPAFSPRAGAPAAGEIIGSKYEVERVLGAGGMGVVVAARHLQLGQRVAIKFMLGDAAHEAGAVSRFLREARASAALTSDHVTKVLDVGTLDTGEPYMVMEYLAGVDLAQLVETHGPMAVGDAVGAVLQACEALAEAHLLGIVHRDLKPSNLFVTKRRNGSPLVKVLDFGISKTVELNAAGGQENLTASGLIMGSPGYMSPEQLRSAKAADARSDIWSLGVITYELLTGKAPFTGETLGETFARIISEAPTPIRLVRPEVPDGLAAVIMRCLERDAARRIQTVDELATELAPFASREGRSVERPGTMTAASFSAAGSDSGRGAPSADTGPAWLRSGSSLQDLQPRFRVMRLAVAGLAFVVLAAAATALSTRGWRSSEPEAKKTTSIAAGAAPAVAAPVASGAGASVEAHAATRESVTATPEFDAGVAVPARGAFPRAAPGQPQGGAVRGASPGASKPTRDNMADDLLERRQ